LIKKAFFLPKPTVLHDQHHFDGILFECSTLLHNLIAASKNFTENVTCHFRHQKNFLNLLDRNVRFINLKRTPQGTYGFNGLDLLLIKQDLNIIFVRYFLLVWF
jgi:hypothetical protein